MKPQSNERSLENLVILVIDDDKDILAFVEALLHDMGASKVICASEGSIGLSYIFAASAQIDIVICDWNMPHVTGLDILKKTKASFPKITFAMLTAKSEEQDVVAAKNLGVDMYIAKPVVPASFREMIQKLATRASRKAR